MTRSDNDRTLQAYNDRSQDYITANARISDSLKAAIDRVLERVPLDGKILEIGSGSGRDADYIESRGYEIERTDAAEAFVSFIRSQGHEVRQLNVLFGDFGKDYDLIYAQAVFLHFGPDTLIKILRRSYHALKEGALLAFSVKEGEGDGWTKDDYLGTARYYHFWQEPDLRKIVEAAGLKDVEITRREGTKDVWLHVMARK